MAMLLYLLIFQLPGTYTTCPLPLIPHPSQGTRTPLGFFLVPLPLHCGQGAFFLLIFTSEWRISKSRPLVPQTSALPLRHTLERVTGIEPAPSAWRAEVIAIRPHSQNPGGGEAGKQPDRNRLPLLPSPLESARKESADSTGGVCWRHGSPAGKRVRRQSSATRLVITLRVERRTFRASTGRSCQPELSDHMTTEVAQYPQPVSRVRAVHCLSRGTPIISYASYLQRTPQGRGFAASGYSDSNRASPGPKPGGSPPTLYPAMSGWWYLKPRSLTPEASVLPN